MTLGGLRPPAGDEVVIEELLIGPEISVLAFSDGYTIVPLPAAQDHKRIGEGDTGLNTGGMGAYTPAPVATPAIMEQISRETLKPTIDGMRREGPLLSSFLLEILQPIRSRLSFRRPPVHGLHPHRLGTKSTRVQRPVRRPRDAGVDVTPQRGDRSGSDHPGTASPSKSDRDRAFTLDVYIGLRRTTTGFRGDRHTARLCRFRRFSLVRVSW